MKCSFLKHFYNNSDLMNEKGRLYFFDNAKFILIFLVVLAHAISPLKSKMPSCMSIWTVANTFHMPAFVFISGFFAKSYISKDGGIKVQRPATYAILYLASQIAVTAFELFVLKEKFTPSIFTARSSLWFLQCLVIWHLILPCIIKFKPWIVISCSIAIALLVGYDKNCGNFLSLSRAFVHFPFFMCGYYCSQKNLEKLFCKKVRIVAVVVIISALLIARYVPEVNVLKLITCNNSYFKIPEIKDLPFFTMWIPRALFYIAAFLIGGAFLSIVPRGKVFYTLLGAQSLSVYILHRFLFLAYLEYRWYTSLYSAQGAILMSVIALAITFIFSVKPFTIPFNALQKIKVDKLLKK